MESTRGKFYINAVSLALMDADKRTGATRVMFEEAFIGPLEAARIVVVMGTMNKGIGSGGCVALDRIEGTLKGRKRAFCLLHPPPMKREKAGPTITVVPGSGTDELVGLSGSMTIDIITGEHVFAFGYFV